MTHLSAMAFVGAGGAAGALLRYFISAVIQPAFPAFPFSTLIVNAAGCLMIGATAGLAENMIPLSPAMRLLLVTGFCGAFTTMSTFVFETDKLLRIGQIFQAAAYFCGTIMASFILFYAGFHLAKAFFKAA